MNTALTTGNRSSITWMALAMAIATLPVGAHATTRATADPDGRNLTIVGDRGANDVAIALDGNDVEVSDGGTSVGRFGADGVATIRVRLGGGDDSLTVQLATDGALASLGKVSVSLGSGDDLAVVDTNPGVRVVVSGGPGDDGAGGLASSEATFRSIERQMREAAAAPNTGRGPNSLGYSCSGGSCECDKSIENDCEDMSAECTLDSIPALDACINGWLTTHCSCPKVSASRPTKVGKKVNVGAKATKAAKVSKKAPAKNTAALNAGSTGMVLVMPAR